MYKAKIQINNIEAFRKLYSRICEYEGIENKSTDETFPALTQRNHDIRYPLSQNEYHYYHLEEMGLIARIFKMSKAPLITGKYEVGYIYEVRNKVVYIESETFENIYKAIKSLMTEIGQIIVHDSVVYIKHVED